MPEGDTIFRTAVTLARRLEGHALRRLDLPRRPGGRVPSPGTRVEHVEARGKHLLIGFGGERVLHTHLRMHGSWHTYLPDERWRRRREDACAVIEVDDAVAVCFGAPVVELLERHELERHPRLRALGPDLCSSEPDLGEALRRLDALDPSTEIGVAMLDQRVACGVGNVYKSEVLWAERVDPFAPVGTLEPETRRALLATASTLLRRNLAGGSRTTYGSGLAVYGNGGRACPRCGAAIVSRRQGVSARTTWWCPRCQTPDRGSSQQRKDV